MWISARSFFFLLGKGNFNKGKLIHYTRGIPQEIQGTTRLQPKWSRLESKAQLIEDRILQAPFTFESLICLVVFNFAKGRQLETSELKNAGNNGIDVPRTVGVISGVSFCPNGVNRGG